MKIYLVDKIDFEALSLPIALKQNKFYLEFENKNKIACSCNLKKITRQISFFIEFKKNQYEKRTSFKEKKIF